MEIQQRLPSIVSGYELNSKRDLFSVVTPEATTNLVDNPSLELNSTGYSAVGGASIARSTEQQYKGAWSLKVTPGAGGTDGMYYGTVPLVADQRYTFSFYFKGIGGVSYKAYFATSPGGQLGDSKHWRSKGSWERITVGWTEITTASRRVYIVKDGGLSTGAFHVDALQVEAKDYATTYVDGDQKGFIPGQQAYVWGGPPHASASYRTAQTRSGGKLVPLRDLGFFLTAFNGMGMPGLDIISTPYATLNGAFFQRDRFPPRSFSIIGTIAGINLTEVLRHRASLVEAFRPDSTSVDQPLLLQYQGWEGTKERGDPQSIVCNYAGGLEGNSDNIAQERLAISFTQMQPHIDRVQEAGAELDLNIHDNRAGEGKTFFKGSDGIWAFNVSETAPDQEMVAAVGGGGQVHMKRNASSGYDIVRYDPYSGANTLLGNTSSNFTAMAVGPDGSVYIGSVTNVDGVVINSIAKYDPLLETWSDLGASAPGGVLIAMVVDVNGALYVSAGGGLVYFDGTNWNNAWTGAGFAGGGVDALALDRDGLSVYAAGDFTSIDGVALARIAKWSGTVDLTWSALGSGINGGVLALAVDIRNHLFAGGDFSTAGGVAAPDLAEWNGVGWAPLSVGIDTLPISYPMELLESSVRNLFYDDLNQRLYVGVLPVGGAIPAGRPRLISPVGVWTGTHWLPWPVRVEDTIPNVNVYRYMAAYGLRQSAVRIGSGGGNIEAWLPAQTIVTNPGSAEVYPTFRFWRTGGGAGTLHYLSNETTGLEIYFDSLSLNSGEIITLTLSPGGLSLSSSTRGNLLSSIVPGSDLSSFKLLPGDNRINLLYHTDEGAGVVDEAVIYFSPASHGV